MDLGHSTRHSISNTQETAEYHASVGTLQSGKENKGVCRCIIIWTRSPTPERTRLLTDTEQRYAQVEKEAFAVTWCCEKFSEFLIGLKMFTIETDHKLLLALLKTKHLDELTPRIQRF